MKIAIIGAGIAGTSAASLLIDQGHSVDIFEKSRGLGGRLTTKRLDWAHIDTGAQYFTARDPRFIQQVEQWQTAKAAELWEFEPFSIQNNKLVRSSDNTKRYVGTPRMNSIIHDVAKNLDITLSTRISQVNLEHFQSGQVKWRLIDEANKEYHGYDWLISSAPIEQTQHLLDASPSNLTTVSQQLPRNAHLPCWAIALATKGKIHDEIQGIFGDETISWVSRQSTKPQRTLLGDYHDCWLVHFSSQWSAQHHKDTSQNLPQIALNWLNTYLLPFRENAGQALKCEYSYQHFWLYAKLRDERSALAPIIEPDLNIAIIGDWCFSGRVEGSYLSAAHLADFLSK